MPDDDDGQSPHGESNRQALAQPPTIALPEKSVVADHGKGNTDQIQNDTEKKLHWLEIGYFSSQIVLAVIGTWALCIYHGQLTAMNNQLTEMGKQSSEIQKQTTLMQNETVGTKGAVLQFYPALNVLASKEDGPVFSSTVKAWSGRVTARNIVLRINAQRIVLPSGKPIGRSIQCDIITPQLASLETVVNEISRVCELPGFDISAADEVMFTRQSVTISGSLSYDNGFSQTTHQGICQTFLGYRYRGENLAPNGSMNTYSGGDESFHPCEDFARVLHRALRTKNKYQENYVPTRP